MTKSQEIKLNMIRRDAELMASQHHKDGEVKTFDVKEYSTFISVYVCIGAKNDEGTMAEIYCRDKVTLFIGKKGAVTFPVWDQKHHEQRYKKYRSMFCACYDYDNNVTKGSTKR